MRREVDNPHSRGWLTRAALAAVAVLGLFLIVLPLATSLPGKSAASGDMMTAFRPHMTDASLAQAANDQKTLAAMGIQLNDEMLPQLAAQLHMTPQQLAAFMAANYPATAKGMADSAAMDRYFGSLLTTMRDQQSNFQQADQIPTGFLPPTAMTPLFIVPGVLLLGAGLFGLLRPARVRAAFAAATGVGLVTVIGLLAVSMYSKASAADEMNAAFKPVFAAQSVQQARAYTDTAQAMSAEFTTATLPGIATALHVPTEQLIASMQQSYPAVAAGVEAMPQIMARMASSTALIEGNVDNYNQSTSIPWSPGSLVTMFWMMMVPALAAAVIGAGALVALSRRPFALQPVPTMGSAAHH